MHQDKKAQEAIEETSVPPKGGDQPAAGPHATSEQTDREKTPGTGLLPEERDDGVAAPSG